MRGFVAVFSREVFERRLLGLVALLLGVTAVVLPLVPGLLPGSLGTSDLQGGLAFGVALLLSALLALFLGASMIVSDLAEHRLGFYFSRPLAGWAIWAGKVAGALALVFGSALLVLAPALLVGGNLNLSGMWGVGDFSVSGPSLVAAWIVGLLLLLFAAHAASVILRARSAWALLDMVALALVAGLVWGALRRLESEGVVFQLTYWSGRSGKLGILAWMEVGLLVVLLIALAAAGALQVSGGRTDLRQSHRILSLALWGPLLAAAVAFMGLASWILAAGPDDLLGVARVYASPAGRWIAFTGPAAGRPGYDPSFLYDMESGRSVRVRFGLISLYDTSGGGVYFSADGRKAVWMEFDSPPTLPFVVYQLDLSRPDARPERTSISFQNTPYGFALSPDGRRIAMVDWAGRLIVEEIGGRLLVTTRYERTSSRPVLAFAGSDRLRILEIPYRFEEGAPPTDLFEVDLAAKSPRVVATGTLAPIRQLLELTFSPDAGHALQQGRNALQLCDARSGALLAVLGDGQARGSFLRDGRVVVAARVAGGQEMRLFAPDGRSEIWRLPFPGARSLILAEPGTAPPGFLRALTLGPKPSDPAHQLWEVDVEQGTARSLGPRRLASLDAPRLTFHRDRRAIPVTGKDGVIWFDPAVLHERVVLKGF